TRCWTRTACADPAHGSGAAGLLGVRGWRAAGCSLTLLVSDVDELGVLTFAGVRRGDRVQQLAGDRFGAATHRPYRGEADQVVPRGDAAPGPLVQVAPVPAGEAALVVAVEHERVLQGGDHTDPLLGLLFVGQGEGSQVVVAEPARGLGVAAGAPA